MKSFREYLTEVDDADLLKRFSRRKGVDLDIDIPHPKHHADWHVKFIARTPKGKTGAGGKVMRAVGKLADKRKRGVFLDVEPTSDVGGGLKKWYRGLGYKDTGEYGEDGDTLRRKPRSK